MQLIRALIFYAAIVIPTISYAGDVGTLTLVCTFDATNSTGKIDSVFTVNFDTKQVNGYNAQITEYEIIWHHDDDSYTTINRRTGFIRVGSAKFPSLFQGHCEKAPDKKF